MKPTTVDRDGNVRCPKCGSKQFTSKRTGKAKWAGALTFGVGVGAMPKRLKCQGCGENLKTGSARGSEWDKEAEPESQSAPVASAAPPAKLNLYTEYANIDEVKMRADEIRVGDLMRWAGHFGVIEDLTQEKRGMKVQLDDGKKAVGLASSTKVKVRRLSDS